MGEHKSVHVHQVPSWCLSLLCMVHFSLECFARELIVTELHTSATCGCLVALVCVALWSGCVAGGRAFSLSNYIELAVASVEARARHE